MSASEMYDRVVIGAGVAGLLAARRALARGERVLLLDRAQTVGGTLQAIPLAGVPVDAGAEAFSVAEPHVFTLLDELGLRDAVVTPRSGGARIVLDAHTKYQIPHGMLGIPASLDDPELTRVLSPEALREARARDAAAVQLPEPADAQLTVAELVQARLGTEVLTRLVEPTIAGVHGSSAHLLDARTTLAPVLRAMPHAGSLCQAVAEVRAAAPRPGAAVNSIRGGMHLLPQALLNAATQAGATVCTGASDITVHGERGGWLVVSREQQWLAAELTVATGSQRLPRIAALEVASLEAASLKAASLESAAHDAAATPSAIDVALVFAQVKSEQLNDFPLGSGALIAAGSGFAAKATTHVNAKWEWVHELLTPNTHLLRFSIGRSGVIPPGDLESTASHEIAEIYGVNDLRVQKTRLLRWQQALNVPSPEHTERQARLADRARAAGIELSGSMVSGNGLLGIVKDHYR